MDSSSADQRSFTRDHIDLSRVAEEAAETLLAFAEQRDVTIETSGGVLPPDPGWGESPQGLSPEQQERQLCVAVRAGRCRELAAPDVDVPAGAADDCQSCQVRPALDAQGAELASGQA